MEKLLFFFRDPGERERALAVLETLFIAVKTFFDVTQYNYDVYDSYLMRRLRTLVKLTSGGGKMKNELITRLSLGEETETETYRVADFPSFDHFANRVFTKTEKGVKFFEVRSVCSLMFGRECKTSSQEITVNSVTKMLLESWAKCFGAIVAAVQKISEKKNRICAWENRFA